VIPDEREGFLKRRFNEPMIHERIKQDKWKVITYNKLEKYSKLKKKTPKSFNKLCENLKDKGRNQTKIRDF